MDPWDKDFVSKSPANMKPPGTCDGATNSYSDPKQVKICPEGKRIDHILYKLNPAWEVCISMIHFFTTDRHAFDYLT